MDPQCRVTCRPSLIFIFFCLGVQTFMAYNGGATSSTVENIKQLGSWGPAHLGLLGAMDKLGMTVASPIVGFFLQIWPSKTLLCVGLGINASSTLLFATLDNHVAMYLVKFLMGLTEGLQWVWAPLWITRWADQEHVSLWMTISGGVVAGVGSGLGILVGGLGTANGLSYAFAFKVEALVLFALWFGLLTVSRLGLSIKADIVREASLASHFDLYGEQTHSLFRTRVTSQESLADMSAAMLKDFKAKVVSKGTFRQAAREHCFKTQIQDLWNNRVFCFSALALAAFNFTSNGMQFSWILTFICLWDVSKDVAVFSFLFLVAAGGALGIVVQSWVRISGSSAVEREQIAKFVFKAYVLSVFGACMAFVSSLLHLQSILPPRYSLIAVWLSMFIVAAGLNSTSGLLQILCTKSVADEQTRSLGTGIYQCLSNCFGMAFGPFLPQFVVSMAETIFNLKAPGSDGICDNSKALFAGFSALLLGPIVGCFFAWFGLRAAKRDNTEQLQTKAIPFRVGDRL